MTPRYWHRSRRRRQRRKALQEPSGGETIIGPDLWRIEVTSALRRHANSGQLNPGRSDAAITDLLDVPISVFPTAPLLRRVWELRSNLTAYEGCYVALTETLGAVLLTAHHHLAPAPGPRCHIEALRGSG